MTIFSILDACFSRCLVISELPVTFLFLTLLKHDFNFTVIVNTPQKLCFITAKVTINAELCSVLVLYTK